MARSAASCARPWLLPPLLLLIWAPPGAENRKVVVQAPSQVHGFLNHTVQLPCNLQPLEPGVQVTQVTWMRRELSGDARSVAVFHPTQGPSFPESGRLQFAVAKPGGKLWDATLVVSGLRAEDEANYTCEFATFPQGSGSARTWLRVLAKPKNHIDIQEDLLGPEPVATARCISTGGRPAPQVFWSSSLPDRNVIVTQTAGLLPGTFNVTSQFNFTPSRQLIHQNVTCRVEHESFKEPILLSLTLNVHYPPEVSISGYDGTWYLGQKEVTLNCYGDGNPEPTDYVWSTIRGSLPPSAVAEGSTLRVHTVDKSINTTFICSATNTLGTRQAELTVLLTDEPPGGSDSGLTLKIILPILAILILAVIVFCLVKKSGQCCGKPANPTESYSAVSTNQDPPRQNAQSAGGTS